MRTYLDYVNLFWRKNREHFVGVHAMGVYFHLLEVCNYLGWPKNFRQADRFIAVRLQISEKTVQRAKKTLAKMGLISYKIPTKKGRGVNGSTSYSLIVKKTLPTILNTVDNSAVNTEDYNSVYGVVDNADNDSVDSSVYGADSSANTLDIDIDIDIDKDYIKKEDKSSKKEKSKKSIKNSENETPKKLSAEKKIFIKPTVDEIQEFLEGSGGPPIDAEYFFNYYEANGWIVGKVKMKDWRATVRNWQKRDFTTQPKETKRLNHPMTNYSGQKTNADDRF